MTISPEMSAATQWGSHLPALLACIAVTERPVLELGVGHFSTPQLHALCMALGRDLTSVEADPAWHAAFAKYRHASYGNGVTGSVTHTVFIGDYLQILGDPLKGLRWGAALIDNSPGGAARAELFRWLILLSDFVIVHDAQKDAENFQHIEPMLDGLHWHLCTDYFPHTLVVSKTREIPKVLLGM